MIICTPPFPKFMSFVLWPTNISLVWYCVQWLWGHPLDHGEITGGHIFKKECFSHLQQLSLPIAPLYGLEPRDCLFHWCLGFSWFDLVHIVIATMGSWIWYPCQARSNPFHPLALTFLLPPLLQCFLSLGRINISVFFSILNTLTSYAFFYWWDQDWEHPRPMD